jgi:hypothetical protein
MRLLALLAVLAATSASACGGSGTSSPSGTTTQGTSSKDVDRTADSIAKAVGKQAYCYPIGSIEFRKQRTDLFQCELGATGNVNCYVEPGRKPVLVDPLLARNEVSRSLQGSDLSELACGTS